MDVFFIGRDTVVVRILRIIVGLIFLFYLVEGRDLLEVGNRGLIGG